MSSALHDDNSMPHILKVSFNDDLMIIHRLFHVLMRVCVFRLGFILRGFGRRDGDLPHPNGHLRTTQYGDDARGAAGG